MDAVLTVILPVFGLIGLGYAARRTGYLREAVGAGLSGYVFGAAVPALIFRTLAQAGAPPASPWAFWAAYFGGVAAAWALASLAVARGLRGGWRKGVTAGITAGFSNTILLGIPLVLTAVGEEGAVPLSLLLSVHLPVLFLSATLLMESSSDGGRRRRPAEILGTAARNLATNPIVIAIAAGAAWRLGGLEIPAVAASLLGSLAASAVPCALFAMGMELARYGVFGEARATAVVVAAKLLVHPLVVFLLARYAFGLPEVWTAVAVIFAATPTGVNAYLFATRYDEGVALASSGIALSTAGAVVTVAVWLSLLGF